MGLWMAPLNITRKHDGCLIPFMGEPGLLQQLRGVVVHNQTAVQMHEKHERLQKSTFQRQCNQEYRDMVEYEYDWSNLPSKCCSAVNGGQARS